MPPTKIELSAAPGEKIEASFTVTNTGAGTLFIRIADFQEIDTDDDREFFLLTDTEEVALKPGQSKTYRVEYRPVNDKADRLMMELAHSQTTDGKTKTTLEVAGTLEW